RLTIDSAQIAQQQESDAGEHDGNRHAERHDQSGKAGPNTLHHSRPCHLVSRLCGALSGKVSAIEIDIRLLARRAAEALAPMLNRSRAGESDGDRSARRRLWARCARASRSTAPILALARWRSLAPPRPCQGAERGDDLFEARCSAPLIAVERPAH